MTHAAEKFIMEPAVSAIPNNPTKKISLSRNLVLILVLIFVSCIVATGLLVYHFTSCSRETCEEVENREVSALSSCKNYTQEAEPAAVHTTEVADVTTATVTTTTERKTPQKTELLDVRLPNSVIPRSYRLKLIPFIWEGNFTFHGEVTILVEVAENTSNVTLHAATLEIQKSSLNVYENSPNFPNVPVTGVDSDQAREFLIINLGEQLSQGKQYYINIKFKGVLNNYLQGFYRSSYTDGKQTRWIASTQFQPTDARKAFPCFDEPALKAKFKVSIARPRNMTSISNTPKIGKAELVDGINDYVWDHFQETVPMSTYLLAFIVFDFESISNGTFSVWARHSAIAQSKYALQIGPDILKFYEKFFGIDFPLPKIDMVAVPDFSAGAMENWGLITYRETMLLHEEGVSNRLSLQNIATVIAHELAHQWFGNLVTPTWWTDLWLNEGFATYMEYVGTNAIKPEWKLLDQMVVNELHTVFSMDALKTSHQISIQVNDTNEINDIFDRISYSKGATIIRMMDNFLTTKVFRNGLKSFLSRKKYNNADQDYLWDILSEEAHKANVLEKSISVKTIMDTWTLQVGFPVVTVHRIYKNNTVFLTQNRFFVEAAKETQDNQLWWIPITFVGKTNDSKTVWMKAEREITLPNIKTGPSDWLLVNVNQTGYYRVNYDERNWRLLTHQLRKPNGHLVFDPKNRAQMIDDALNLAAAGYLNYEIALNITRYLVQEKEYLPWKAAFNGLDYISGMIVRTGSFDKYKAYAVSIINGFYNHLGFRDLENDKQLDVYSRTEVLYRACRLEVQDCMINAVRLFENWRSTPDPDKNNPISPNLRDVVYCTAIRVGGQEHWDFAYERYQRTNVGTEKAILMSALGCSREAWILSRYLDWAVTEEKGIRKQDAPRVFTAVSSNVIGHDLAYMFLKSNWDRIKQYMGVSSSMLNAVVRSCTNKLNTRQEVEDLKSFAKSKELDFGVASRAMQQSIEHGEANVQWMEKNFKTIVKWLTKVTTS